jgi:hypothetical protein
MKSLKTKIVSIFTVLSVLMCGNVKADNVDLQTAKQIGAYYYNVATGTKAPVSAEKLELVQQFDNPTLCIPALYAFNVAGNGFVVVSASNTTDPVLAYSPEGRLDNLNPACQYMLESYARLISQDQNHNATPTAEIKGKWDELINQTFTCDLSTKAVLVKAKWGQGDPNAPSYNVFCPQVQGKPCLVGCVATAMASIMHYWKYPVKGGGSNSSTAVTNWNNQTIKYKFAVDSNKFIFDSMPNQINERSEWNYKRACGKISFACGVTVKMDWGLDGSGAVSQNVPGAFYNWFKYSDQATHIYRSGRTDEQWLEILHNEIDANSRPVYYSASDPDPGHGEDAAGHAFVIAGSSAASQSMFYIRWGWDGGSDGFYTLAPASAIGNAGTYHFTDNHGMVYKIFPREQVGIEENTAFSTSPAYPNPATDHIMIPVDMSLNMYLSTYSIDGKLIENIVVPAGTKEYRLNLQNYAPGNYIYRLNGSAVKFTVL